MNEHNELGFRPGPYLHHKGSIFVALDVITHAENAATGDMEQLEDPDVVYRDLEVPVEHYKGRLTQLHRRYRMKLSEWNKIMEDGQKRFTAI